MVKFKTFFNEGLGLFPKTNEPTGVMAALSQPLTPEEKAKKARDREIIAKYAQKRADTYPDGKYNFQLVDGFKSMMATAWRALPKPGQEDKAYSLLLLGDPGVGKSDVILGTSQKLKDAENKAVPSTKPDGTVVERKFVRWDKLSYEAKATVSENPEDYYVFMDIRTAYLTTAGMEGLPVPENQRISKSKFFRNLPQEFISFITQEKSAGVLFLDEINQASREVFAILYQVINNRVFKDIKIAPRILVLAAGNIGGSIPNEMEPALSSRFVGAVLVPDPDAWFEWATENNLNNVIIDYVRTDPDETFYKYPTARLDAAQWPNPRAITRFNTQFENVYAEYEELKAQDPESARRMDFEERVFKEAKGTCGPEWGEGFLHYLRAIKEIDLEKLASGNGAEYEKLGKIEQQQAKDPLQNRILQDIDDAITSKAMDMDVGFPPQKTYSYDENKLNANLQTAKILISKSSDDTIKQILGFIKKRQPQYFLILLDNLTKDPVIFKKLESLEKTLLRKTEQI
jgi:hypothetical protein